MPHPPPHGAGGWQGPGGILDWQGAVKTGGVPPQGVGPLRPVLWLLYHLCQSRHKLPRASLYSHKLVDILLPDLVDKSCCHKLVDTAGSHKLVDTSRSHKLVDTPCSHKLVDTSGSHKVVDTSGSHKLVDTSCSHKLVDTYCSHTVVDTSCSHKLGDTSHSHKLVDRHIPSMSTSVSSKSPCVLHVIPRQHLLTSRHHCCYSLCVTLLNAFEHLVLSVCRLLGRCLLTPLMSHKDSMCSLTALIEQSVLRNTDCFGETRLVPLVPSLS